MTILTFQIRADTGWIPLVTINLTTHPELREFALNLLRDLCRFGVILVEEQVKCDEPERSFAA